MARQFWIQKLMLCTKSQTEMKKLTQILSLDFGANYLSEENKDGKILDATEIQMVKFIPFTKLLKI